jgi:hypothetical protein
MSGMIEVSIQESFSEYARVRSGPRVYAYVDKQVGHLQNPKMEKIISLAASFDPAWAESLRVGTDGQLKDAVDSIVANRNSIAHGDPVGLSFSRLQEYHNSVCKVLDLVQSMCR